MELKEEHHKSRILDYLPLAIIVIIYWQILKAIVWVNAYKFYYDFRSSMMLPAVGIPAGLLLAVITFKLTKPPAKKKMLASALVILGMVYYTIYATYGLTFI